MIDLQQIKTYFPAELRENAAQQKYMLKEYVQLLVLDFLSTLAYICKIAFIGDTNLPLVKELTVFRKTTRDKQNEKLRAFRLNFYIPT